MSAAREITVDLLERRQLLTTYNLNSVASFYPYPQGAYPTSQLVSDTQGNLYGTTGFGGSSGAGTIFELAAGSRSFSTIASFPAGAQTSALTIDSRGDLFGTYYSTKQSNGGTVFEVAAGSNNITAVVIFSGYPNDFAAPVTLDASGDIFGTSPLNSIFEIRAGTSSATTLASFSAVSGSNLFNRMILDASGNLYGTTPAGASGGGGAIFELPSGSTSVVTLAAFNSSTGEQPGTNIVRDTAGDIFGTTTAGGSAGDGTVFELASGSSSIAVISSFTGSNGDRGTGGLIADSNGNLYGATMDGGPTFDGSIFRIASGTTSINTLATFGAYDIQQPEATLCIDSSGNLYGTAFGSASTASAVFELPSGSSAYSVLHRFNAVQGDAPEGGVVLDSSGNLYGTTTEGGVGTLNGSIYEIASGTSSITTLASFPSYVEPRSLSIDVSGNLYGTGDSYSIFKYSPGNATPLTSITFGSAAGQGLPSPYLSTDAQGDVFGTTTDGPVSADGTIFEIRAGATSITTLGQFSATPGSTVAPDPIGGVIVDSSGDLYGATEKGGAAQDGTLYELPAGSSSIVTLATFGSASGTFPEMPITRDAAGDLFGTTTSGGSGGDGTIFELAAGASTITTLAAFGSSTNSPASGVTEDAQGDFFGVSSYSVTSKQADVFELKPGGASVSIVASLSAINSSEPNGNLRFDASGNLYGTTEDGGTVDAGQVFELTAVPAPMITLTSPANGSTITSTTPTFSGVAGTRAVDAPLAVVRIFAGTSASGNFLQDLDAAINPTTGLYSVAASSALSPGTYTAQASLTDLNDETTHSAPVTFTVVPDDSSFTVDNGTSQRSMVRTLTVQFTAPVTLASGAITLTKTSGGTSTPITFTNATSDGGTTYRITPTAGTVGGSLTDGSYALTVHANGVHAVSSPAIAAVTDRTYTFFRLFGDSNGDGTVNLVDYRAFAVAYLKSSGATGYNFAFDFNSDGTINLIDYRAFAANYLKTITAG